MRSEEKIIAEGIGIALDEIKGEKHLWEIYKKGLRSGYLIGLAKMAMETSREKRGVRRGR